MSLMGTRPNGEHTKVFAYYLGRGIKAARKLRGMKASTLAFEIGITEQSVSNIETGKAVPSMKTLLDMARHLNVPLWQLIRPAEKFAAIADTMAMDAERRRGVEDETG
jgi:transcriptional regulator with XRE-family HTH domain